MSAQQPGQIEPSGTKQAIFGGLTRWGFFGVILALIPIIASAIDAFTRDDPHFHFEALFERGELLLVAAAVLGASLAELFAHSGRVSLRNARTFAGLFSGLVLITAAIWFADIQAGIRDKASLDHHRIAIGSMVVFMFALIAGASCVILAQFEEPRR